MNAMTAKNKDMVFEIVSIDLEGSKDIIFEIVVVDKKTQCEKMDLLFPKGKKFYEKFVVRPK